MSKFRFLAHQAQMDCLEPMESKKWFILNVKFNFKKLFQPWTPWCKDLFLYSSSRYDLPH